MRILAGEAGWVAAGQLFAGLGALVSVRLLTEVLPPASYGQLVLLLGLATLAFNFSAWPLLNAAMRFRAEFTDPTGAALLRRESVKMLRWSLLGMGAVVMIAGAAFGPTAGLPVWVGVVLVCVVLADTARTYETSLLNAARRQKAMALWRASDAWGRPLLAVAFVLAFAGGAPLVLLGFALATGGICLVFARLITLEGKQADADQPTTTGEPESGPGPVPTTSGAPEAAEPTRGDEAPARAQHGLGARSLEDAPSLRRRIWTFVLPLLPIAGLTWITSVGDRYILAALLSLEAAGIYAALYAVVSRPFLMLGGFLDTWLRPRFYEAAAKRRWQQFGRIIAFWVALALAIGTFGVVCFVVLSDIVALVLLAEPYRAAADLMPWIAVGYALNTVSQVFLRVCFAFERTELVLWIRCFAAAAALIISIPLIASYGLWGAAVAVPGYLGAQLLMVMVIAAIVVKGQLDTADTQECGK